MNSKSHNSFPYTHVVGFLLSIALTIATLFVAFKTGLSAGIVMIIIAGLAVAQAGLQLFMFMHMTEGEDRDTKVVHTVYSGVHGCCHCRWFHLGYDCRASIH